mgnify:CR=1 FL=1
MKIIKSQLKQIIKEEMESVLNENIKSIIAGALEDAELSPDTELSGYGVIGGGHVILVPKDPMLNATNWRPTGPESEVHTGLATIVPEKVGVDTEAIVSHLQGLGLKQVRIHTGAGWME